jgi:hypothetical protein
VLSELLRPVLRFLFWNRRRPAAAAAVLIIVIAVIARGASGSAHGHTPGSGHPRPAATAPAAASRPVPSPPAGTAAPAAALPSAPPQPAATGPPPPAALAAARQFMSAWVSSGPGWASRLRPFATTQLDAQLSGTSPRWSPATAVTGPAEVTSQAPGTVSLTVPTNAGPALVTVRLVGGRWLAAAVMLARTGN